MIRKWFFPLLLSLSLSAYTLTTPRLTVTPALPNGHSSPLFRVFIINSLTTCLVGNGFTQWQRLPSRAAGFLRDRRG